MSGIVESFLNMLIHFLLGLNIIHKLSHLTQKLQFQCLALKSNLFDSKTGITLNVIH